MKIFVDGTHRSAVSRMFHIWRQLGHELVGAKNADIQLSSVNFRNDFGKPKILRLDGVYYDKAINYKRRNRGLSKSHKNADGIVYQSQMSKMMCEKYLLKRTTHIYDIIYNGLDCNWNNPHEHKSINIVTCSKWRRFKRLPEIVEVFLEFLKFKKAILHIIGPMRRGAYRINHPRIRYYGRIGHKRMKKIYSNADIYLHLAKKDSCPSTVVEAIGAGVPVLTTNACGGATEMCRLTKGCIVVSGEKESVDPDYIYRDKYNYLSKHIRDKMVKYMLDVVRQRVKVVLPKELEIEHVAKKYLRLMERVLDGYRQI